MYSEGNLISFTELSNNYEGIIIEQREDSSLIVFDTYGNIKTVYSEDVITTDIKMNIKDANTLLKYYKYHLEQKKYEEIVKRYKDELNELRTFYSEKIKKNHNIIERIKESKIELIDNLEVYTYTNINKKFNEFLDVDIKIFEIFTDYTNTLTKIVFNRFYTLAEEGTFNVNELEFINYLHDGQPYTLHPEEWNENAKKQAKVYIDKIDKSIEFDTIMLNYTKLTTEDKIILGGSLKDLTLERNYKFTPNKISNKKEEIDNILEEVSNFAKMYIINSEIINEELLFDKHKEDKILYFPNIKL